MATDVPLLEARGIGRLHRDGAAWLLRDISLAIAAGDRIALTGPTGVGKTVLLRSLAMLDALDAGTICWQGQTPTPDDIPAYRSQSIYLTQRASLFEGTVEQNLLRPFSLAVHRHRSYSRETIVSQIALLGRGEEFLNCDAANLSGGETQIVALLRAMQLDPILLLLDEPTASLDESTSRRIERLIADWTSLPGSRSTFVWVTHDAAQAHRVANRAWRLSNGQLVEREAGE